MIDIEVMRFKNAFVFELMSIFSFDTSCLMGCTAVKVTHYVVSSETSSWGPLGARALRDVLPGEIVELSRGGIVSRYRSPPSLLANRPLAFCIFEYVYFATSVSRFESDSHFAGSSFYFIGVVLLFCRLCSMKWLGKTKLIK